MALFGKGGSSAPRVVGFDFDALAARPAQQYADGPADAPFQAAGAPEFAPVPVYAAAPVTDAPPAAGPVASYPPPEAPVASYPPPAAPSAYPAPPAPAWPPPMTFVPPAYQAPKRGLPVSNRVIGGIVAVVVLGGVARQVTTRDPEPPSATSGTPVIVAPASIGGAPRLITASARQFEQSMYPLVGSKDQGTEIAVYGRSAPRYLLAAIPGQDGTAAGGYAEFRTGAGKDGATVGPPKTYAGGLVCGTFTVTNVHGSLCVWAEKVSSGLVMDFDSTDTAAAASVTAAARKSLEQPR